MKTHLNLIPGELQRRHLARRRVRQWCVVWIAAAAMLTSAAGVEWRRARQAVRQRVAAEERYAPVGSLVSANRRLKTRIESLQKRESLALALADQRPMLALLGVVGSAAQAAQGRVFVQHLQWNEARPDVESAQNARPTAATLRLEGKGEDNFSIARFAAALRDVDLFNQVQVNASNASNSAADGDHAYVIECGL